MAEFGNQRSEDKYDELRATTYFQAFAFLKRKDCPLSVLSDEPENPAPLLWEQNLYAFELSTALVPSTSFPVDGIKPLLEVSRNKFRGEEDLVNATLLADIFDDLKMKRKSLLTVLAGSSDGDLTALRWQEAYTAGTGRRR